MSLSVNILVFTNDWSDFWNIMPYFIFGGPILVVIPIAIASNSGDVRVLQLVRPAAYFIQALWVLNIALAIVSICIFDFDQSVPSVATISIELILLYPIWMMRQSIKVSRWLDPNSRPDEWEIPAINDPNDRAYRGPKSQKKGKQSPPPADHL
jgi:Zn-dependent protease with chaperone function